MDSPHCESSEPEGGHGWVPPTEPASEGPDWAQLAEPNGDAGDLTEFEDLVSSLREAVQMANGERVLGSAGRPSMHRRVPRREVDVEEPAPEAMVDAEPDEEYPDWLTGSTGGEKEAHGLSDEMKKWFGMPSQPQVYLSYESSRISAQVLRCWVTIRSNGHELVGKADGPSLPGVRAEIAAKATLDALGSADGGGIDLSLAAARVLRFADLPLAVVSVQSPSAEDINPLVGAYIVENSEEQAAIMATLRATDRWITGVIGGREAENGAASIPASHEDDS